MAIQWDAKALRFRGERGHFIPRSAVTLALGSARDEVKRRVKRLTEDLREGRINLAQFAIDVRDQLKALHVLSAGIAYGGKLQLSPAILGFVGSQTRFQYERLNNLIREIASGAQPINKRLFARMDLYANASRGTFSEVERRMHRNAGFDVEFNVPHAAEHCEGAGSCQAETSKGKVPIGTLKPIGARRCKVNCQCEIRYERAA